MGMQYGDFKEGELEQLIEKNTILVELELPYEDEMYSITVPNFMKTAATLFLSLYGIMILILLLGDRVRRRNRKPNHQDFIYTTH